jgi:hypothetical protein
MHDTRTAANFATVRIRLIAQLFANRETQIKLCLKIGTLLRCEGVMLRRRVMRRLRCCTAALWRAFGCFATPLPRCYSAALEYGCHTAASCRIVAALP